MVASEHHNTLLHFRFNPEHKAERGRHGEGSNRTGHEGESIELAVPVGTVVYDDETGEKLHDFTHAGERFLVARGGRGGRGNARFATVHASGADRARARQAGRRAAAAAGAEAAGRRRAGRISQRRQIDADFAHFRRAAQDRRLSVHHARAATWVWCKLDDFRSFVVADIPGLIEGAHLGHGLGIQFLRHIERTRLLVHLVDVSEATGRDPVEDFEIVMRELASFSEDLAQRSR